MSYKFKSVKLWAGLGLFTIGTVFAFVMGATFNDWAGFAKWLFGLFVVGNVASKKFG